MIDVTPILIAITGLAGGYLLGYRFSTSYKALYGYRRMTEDIIKHLKRQNMALRQQLANYETPPAISGLDVESISRALGIKLPKWVMPIIQPYIEQLAQNPDKLKELFNRFLKTTKEQQEEIRLDTFT